MDGAGPQADSALNFGLMNALRTGNVVFDMMVCMTIPMVLRAVLNVDWSKHCSTLFMTVACWLGFDVHGDVEERHIRTIEFRASTGPVYRDPNHSMSQEAAEEFRDRNNVLQRAIKMYIREMYPASKLVTEAYVKDFEVKLVPVQAVKMESKRDMYGGMTQSFSGSFQQLQAFGLNRMVRKKTWVKLERNLDFWWADEVVNPGADTSKGTDKGGAKPPGGGAPPGGDGGKPGGQVSQDKVTTYQFRASGPEGGQIIDKFLDEAYEWYLEKKKHEVDKRRFFYLGLQAVKSGISGASGPNKSDAGDVLFKRYELSDNKTFASLFFKEKRSLLKLVDDFQRKQGKFAIAGFPNKLGMLLDGPPGTGKTSLICKKG